MRRRPVLWMLFACWPAVTLALQSAFDVDSWKLMSFGMYATPPRRPKDLSVTLRVRDARGWRELPAGVLSDEVRIFQERRQALGALASPAQLLERALEVTGALEAEVAWRSPRVDPRTGRVIAVTGQARARSP